MGAAQGGVTDNAGPPTPARWTCVPVAAGLTIVDHGHPGVQLALVQHGIEVAALHVAEGGAAGRAALQVAEADTLPLAHAVLALVFGPEGRARRAEPVHRESYYAPDPGAEPHCAPDEGAGPQSGQLRPRP